MSVLKLGPAKRAEILLSLDLPASIKTLKIIKRVNIQGCEHMFQNRDAKNGKVSPNTKNYQNVAKNATESGMRTYVSKQGC